jgi:hypothetical protein
MARRIEVKAGDAEDSLAIVEPAETLKDAKRRARYLATSEYARRAEMSCPFGFVAVYVDGESVFEAARRPAEDYEPCGDCGFDHAYEPADAARLHRPTVGHDYYLPYPEKVARVRVVELGTGGSNLKRVPMNPVVVSEDGGEHVVSADMLYTDELAACIRSAEMAKEIDDE